jgi:hypothetical protein
MTKCKYNKIDNLFSALGFCVDDTIMWRINPPLNYLIICTLAFFIRQMYNHYFAKLCGYRDGICMGSWTISLAHNVKWKTSKLLSELLHNCESLCTFIFQCVKTIHNCGFSPVYSGRSGGTQLLLYPHIRPFHSAKRWTLYRPAYVYIYTRCIRSNCQQ